MKPEVKNNMVIITDDGSSSIYSEQFNCTYHSVHGAIRESEHIFIKTGLDYYLENSGKAGIKILEFGFGTGLNALLSLRYSGVNNVKIDYTAIEAYPVSAGIVSELNYLNFEDLSTYKEEFFSMHFSAREDLRFGDFFQFSKSLTKFEEFSTNEKFDVIFFDAFGPDDQPNLWLRPFLDIMPDLLIENGILITYCVKGSFKRALQELGFKVFKLQGPVGKREILRAKILKT